MTSDQVQMNCVLKSVRAECLYLISDISFLHLPSVLIRRLELYDRMILIWRQKIDSGRVKFNSVLVRGMKDRLTILTYFVSLCISSNAVNLRSDPPPNWLHASTFNAMQVRLGSEGACGLCSDGSVKIECIHVLNRPSVSLSPYLIFLLNYYVCNSVC